MSQTQTKEQALEAYEERRANPPVHIRNEDLFAGSPMYFYCRACGHLAHVRPENYNPVTDGPTKKLCDDCESLQERGWLPDES